MRAREKNRVLRCRGEEYIATNGKKISAVKKPSLKLACKCNWKCSTLSHKQRMLLFNQYRSLDKNSQRSFLCNLVDVVPAHRLKSTGSSRRQVSTVYRLLDEEGTANTVCKSTFQDTFGLSRGEVDVLREKTKMEINPAKDKRGGCYNFKYTTLDTVKIVQFIKLLPKDISYYGRKDSEKEYLSSDLTFQSLFDEFMQKNPEKKISIEFFIRTFKTKFPNLSFHRTRVDTCNTCDKMSAAFKGCKAGSKEEMIQRKNLSAHHEEANLAQSEMNLDKLSPDKNVTCVSIHLQQVIPLPTLTQGEMFYLHQLSCYNLGVHINSDDRAFMCIWHEAIASRGAPEIASCLFNLYNQETCPPLKKNLIVWSNNRPGQNKSKILIMAYMFMIHCGLIKLVEHKFLVPGHSFLSCDEDFALIEKKKRNRILYDLEDVDKLITDSRKNPFEVREMTTFYDFRNVAEWFLNTKKLSLSSVCWFRITSPGKIEVKRHFKQNDFEKFTIWKPGRTASDLDNYEFQAMSSHELSKDKKNDLRKIMNMIPTEKKAFFDELL